MEIKYKDLGKIKYKDAWEVQEKIFQNVLEHKNTSNNGCLLFCEHPHVYTLGKNGMINNLLINNEILKKINAEYYHVDRGGDITYHGPGQIVGYPIFDLEEMKLSLKDYIYNLEKIIISSLKEYDIVTNKLKGATGVWLGEADNTPLRKICAIGVKASKWVTMHGFALNVNTNLSYFKHINPCGFNDKGVTSMQKEIGKDIDINTVKHTIKKQFEKVLNIELKIFS